MAPNLFSSALSICDPYLRASDLSTLFRAQTSVVLSHRLLNLTFPPGSNVAARLGPRVTYDELRVNDEFGSEYALAQ